MYLFLLAFAQEWEQAKAVGGDSTEEDDAAAPTDGAVGDGTDDEDCNANRYERFRFY